MKIINLVENTAGEKGCMFEHGLSFYIEAGEHKLLLDFGQTQECMLQNAKKLGIDLGKVDIAILSHGHYDHAGGILPFIKINPNVKIYMQETACGEYYHVEKKRDILRYIGINKAIKELPQVQFVKENISITKDIDLFAGVKGKRNFSRGNKVLKRKLGEQFLEDDFIHEQYAVIRDGEMTVLFSGCAHNGILNIIDEYKRIYQKYPDIIISGFHMLQKNGYSKRDIENIREVARELKTFPIKFYTGHCTGEFAFSLMKEIMGEQIEEIHSGMRII
ncbi:MAG: MBL fold metallo-hydrolase [Lachnospiraceae bacterium]